MTDYRIGPANLSQLDRLPEIEVRSAEIFPEVDIAPELRQEGLPVSTFECAAREGRLWTASHESTRETVGFALATLVDGSAHLYEMDVLPEHSRRGLGAGLVEAVATWARGRGHRSVTLTTFRHLPWNAPFYERLGFRALPHEELGPELQGLLRTEAEHGLDPAKRVAMQLVL